MDMRRPSVSRIRRPEREQNDRERAAREGQTLAAIWFAGYEEGFWAGYATGKKDKPDA